jgi:dihydroxynaphthoic acid synthetase
MPYRPSLDFNDIIYRKDVGVATIVINRPEKHNAITDRTAHEIINAFEDAGRDDAIGVVVLTGAGDKAFCSGGDVSWEDQGGAYTYVMQMMGIHNAIRHCLKPVIAAVKGYAIGGGHHIAYFCDLTIAADNAIFGQVGPRVGSIADGPMVSYLIRVVGAKKAREIWFLCRRYNAQEALAMGLANVVVPLNELDATVRKWSDEILDLSPTAIKVIKASLDSEFDYARDVLFHYQRMMAPGFFESEESQEGRNAFLEKRKPNFRRFRHLERPSSRTGQIS